MTLKYDHHGRPYEDLTDEHKKLTRRVKELENSLSIALEINDKFQRENVALKKRAQEAEGENTIIKGIGQNSPEMKALQKENEELKKELSRAKEDHQYDNLVHAKELEKALKK
jgi:predicted RNase H-like nuclease (RuvC/YqgF family)